MLDLGLSSVERARIAAATADALGLPHQPLTVRQQVRAALVELWCWPDLSLVGRVLVLANDLQSRVRGSINRVCPDQLAKLAGVPPAIAAMAVRLLGGREHGTSGVDDLPADFLA